MNLNLNFFTNKIFLISFFALFVIYHLVTLSVSPIVWYDETFFNSVTLDFITNHTFFLNVDPNAYHNQEILCYGPVYFVFNGLIISLFENSPFFARLLGLISGLILVLLIANQYRYKIKNKNILIILLLALCLDPFLNASMHKGRNDILAFLFYFIGILFLFKNKNLKISYSFLSAFFYLLAILTTTRLLVFIIPFIIYFLYIFIQKKELRKKIFYSAFVWGGALVFFYFIWILYAFGSYYNYVAYFSSLQGLTTVYLFGNFFIPVEEYPLLLTFIALIIITLIKNKSIFLKSEFVFLFNHLFVFYFLISDTGPYSVLVIPVFYLVFLNIFIHLTDAELKSRYVKIFMIFILLFNAGIFIFKSGVVFIKIENRNYSNVNVFINSNIPKGSKVIGDEVYYYAVLKNNCVFQYMHLLGAFDEIEKYRREVFDYEYLIISDRAERTNDGLFDFYEKNAKLIKIAEFKTQKSDLLNFLKFFSIYDFAFDGYDGIIYKRIK